MFRFRFQTILVMLTTAVLTMVLFDRLRESLRDFNPKSPVEQTVVRPFNVPSLEEGVTIKLPILATTTVNRVVSVPDGGTIIVAGRARKFAQDDALKSHDESMVREKELPPPISVR